MSEYVVSHSVVCGMVWYMVWWRRVGFGAVQGDEEDMCV